MRNRLIRWTLVGSLAASVAFATPMEAASATKPQLYWAVLGDSYSAGVGLGPVTAGCDRDSGAYGATAARALARQFDITRRLLSCAGAKINDVDERQLPSLPTWTNLTTITIGGNDIGFPEKAERCVKRGCGPNVLGISPKSQENRDISWEDLEEELSDLYYDLAKRMADGSRLYVSTYPIPFALQKRSQCGVGLNHRISLREQRAFNALVVRLDDAIVNAVDQANESLDDKGIQSSVALVEWRTGIRLKNGYHVPEGVSSSRRSWDTWTTSNGLCPYHDQTVFINGVRLSLALGDRRTQNSFHPNRGGYNFMAGLLEGLIPYDVRKEILLTAE